MLVYWHGSVAHLTEAEPSQRGAQVAGRLSVHSGLQRPWVQLLLCTFCLVLRAHMWFQGTAAPLAPTDL